MLHVAGQDALSQFGCNEAKQDEVQNSWTVFNYLAKHRFRGVALGIVEAEASVCFCLQRDAAFGGRWLLGRVRPRNTNVLTLHPSTQRAPGVRLIQFTQLALVGARSPKVHILFKLAFNNFN
jgi:hypothetical protein